MNADLDAARAELRVRQGAGARYDAAAAPARDLDRARRGAAYLARIIGNLSDLELDGPSAWDGNTRRRLIAFAGYQARLLAEAIADARGASGASGGRARRSLRIDPELIDFGATLPPQALRHLVRHAAVHLDVEWRDATDADWTAAIVAADGSRIELSQTPRQRAATVWRIAIDLDAGGRIADAPPDLRRLLDDADRRLFGWPEWPLAR